jgi:hypothetical protein
VFASCQTSSEADASCSIPLLPPKVSAHAGHEKSSPEAVGSGAAALLCYMTALGKLWKAFAPCSVKRSTPGGGLTFSGKCSRSSEEYCTLPTYRSMLAIFPVQVTRAGAKARCTSWWTKLCVNDGRSWDEVRTLTRHRSRFEEDVRV